jgi:hypothetical protein
MMDLIPLRVTRAFSKGLRKHAAGSVFDELTEQKVILLLSTNSFWINGKVFVGQEAVKALV